MTTARLPSRPNLGQFRTEAKALLKSFKSEDSAVLGRVRRYHPSLPGRPNTNDRNLLTHSQILRASLSLADARHIIAHEHQFETWPKFARHIEALNRKASTVARFEAAADAIAAGDEAVLRRLLRQNPELVRARSTREHRATLLHYVGANAVEDYRQKTPKNAVQIAEILLQAGSEVDADLDYGPLRKLYPGRNGSTTLGLAATSCHPAVAGVQLALLEILIKYGASVDGIEGGWNPLIAALHNGRGDAAAYLAKHGARLDLEAAAGVGRLDVVRTFFNPDGTLKAKGTKRQMGLGFMWACEYGQTKVVEFLLKVGMDVGSQPHGETGLHWASYAGHSSSVRVLLKWEAPVDVKDKRFNGTPLGWALYGWCQPPPEANPAGYYDIVGALVASGATVDQDWLADPHRGMPIAERVRADKRMLRALKGQIRG